MIIYEGLLIAVHDMKLKTLKIFNDIANTSSTWEMAKSEKALTSCIALIVDRGFLLKPNWQSANCNLRQVTGKAASNNFSASFSRHIGRYADDSPAGFPSLGSRTIRPHFQGPQTDVKESG